MSYTTTESFTITHARKLAAKVVSDMYQCRRFYGEPSEVDIAMYEDELVVLLAGDYIDSYEFGYRTTADQRVVSWRYHVTPAGDLDGGRSGGLVANADVSHAYMFNFLVTNDRWARLTPAERSEVDAQHPVTRTPGESPADGAGRWVRDRTYVAGGVAIVREEFRPW